MGKYKKTNIALGLLTLAALYIISQHNYLLFHSIAEGFSIIIACVIFIIAWNSRHLVNNSFFIFLGTAMLFIGSFDFLHTLSYRGMGIFDQDGSNLPTQLWISARYLQGIAFLVAPLFFDKKVKSEFILIVFSLISAFLLAFIFFTDLFPVCFNDPTGLTPFKKISEYIIILLLLCSVLHLFKYRDKFSRDVFGWIIISIVIAALSEIAFTFYKNPYGFMNLAGHYFKIVPFLFLYKAFVAISLNDPYMSIFRDLKMSEERYHSLFRNMINGFARHRIILDSEGNPVDFIFLDINESFEKLTGLKRENLIGRKVTEVIPGIEKDKADWIGIYGEVANTGEMKNIENYSERLKRWFSVHVYSTEKGYFVTIFEDITDKKLADLALIEEQDRLETRVEERNRELSRTNELLKTIIDYMPVMFCLFNTEGHLHLINNEFKDLTGWDMEDIEKTGILRSGSGHDEEYRHILPVIKEAKSGWNDFLLKRKEGEDLATSWASVRLSDGSIIAIGIDLTERKKMEIKLVNYTEQLEQSNRDLEEFAYIASHDLQEPLRKIRTFGDLLLSRFADPLSETGKDYIERMQKASLRMQKLIDSLLTYSRIATREKHITMVDLNKTVNSAISNLDLRIEEEGAIIHFENLPTIEADGTQMVQLFQNLIGNSIKFHREKEPPVLRIYAQKHTESSLPVVSSWNIFIEDNGLGFDEKYLDQIFSPFQRLHGKGTFDGVGMGLAICKKIVARHNGHITAESVPGKGTTFIITLPEGWRK